MKPGILVTDGEQRAALAAVRALGKAGYPVHVCSVRKPCLAGVSRYAQSALAVPDPLSRPIEFTAAIERFVRAEGIQVILPVAEPSLLAILSDQEQFQGICIPTPGLEEFRRVADKGLVLEVAEEVGIRIPEQQVLHAPEDRATLKRDALQFPLVLKPSRSVGEADGQRSKFGVYHAANWKQLQARLDGLSPAAYPLLLQQRVVGPGVGIFLLLWDGKPLAVFSHKRLREKPPSGGGSVYRESIPAEPSLVERSRALLERLGWWGVAMVEYKVDAATGTPYLMEINGRLWGSLQLAIDAGVDFPTLLVRAALGEHVEPVTRYKLGVKSRWWWGDIDHLLLRIRDSDEKLALPPGAPGRLATLRNFLTLWRPGDRSEILRLRDLRPFLLETREWFAPRR